MLRTAFALIFFTAVTGGVFAQQRVTTTTPPTCNCSEIYNKNGWSIPGLANAKVNFSGAFKQVPGVSVTELSPVEAESTITEISCSPSAEGRLEVNDRPIKILKLRAWEYERHVFAYSVEYELQVMEDGSRVPLGAMTGMIFYDLDGSGLFTVRKTAVSPFLPEMQLRRPKSPVINPTTAP